MNGTDRCDGIAPDLAGVSETMLWSLYNRASEAKRPGGVLADPWSVRIHQSIDYDFARHFGDPQGFLAARAAEIDRVLRGWLERHPDGIVVSLGEGLETQSRRVDNGRLHWLSVDLPAAIRLRERFLAPTRRFRHIAASALDSVWMEAAAPASDVFIVAQGLLMYLEPEKVRQLFTSIADRFPASDIVFDTVPRWFSHLTLMGLNQTVHYRLPPMPWGINRYEVAPTLRRWHPRFDEIAFLHYRVPRGLPRLVADMTSHIPIARHGVPSLVHVTLANTVGRRSCFGPPRSTGFRWEPASKTKDCVPKNPPSFGKPGMTSKNSAISSPDTIGGALALARQNVTHGNDIVAASRRVIARRMALGMAAAVDPTGADRVEFARMIPEKVEAFSTAGMIMLKQSGTANQQMIRLAFGEVMTAARATIEMAGCFGPVALAEAQGRLTRAWFSRATSSFIAMSALILTAQAAVMAPIREAVIANADRLGP